MGQRRGSDYNDEEGIKVIKMMRKAGVRTMKKTVIKTWRKAAKKTMTTAAIKLMRVEANKTLRFFAPNDVVQYGGHNPSNTKSWFTAYQFDIGHSCYGQLTPVKTRYSVASIK